MSGIGKGITVASIGRILKSKGYKVTAIKIDPYINVDAGTMNPVEHGEVFVTEDGLECDQDLGNYERFFDENIYNENYITTGRVYQSVINRERNLEYDGKCVEVVPDIPNEVITRIKKSAQRNNADFVLIEIGGTVGEYQSVLFLEAARMMKLTQPKDILFLLVSYLPIPKLIGEMKTKPTQYAVRTLNAAGIQPDFVVARSAVPLDEPRKKKISIFCNVDLQDIISAPDIESIYEVPINFDKEGIGERILTKFGLEPKSNGLHEWKQLVDVIRNAKETIKIGIIGKYFETGSFTLTDSYISVIEAVKHASYSQNRKPEIVWLSAEKYEQDPNSLKELSNYDGIIVPGGFGNRGTEGKIKAIEFCRKNKVPFLGLCLGMQLATIEFARNVCQIPDAGSRELSENCQNPVIDVMLEQKELLKDKNYGGTMRLGAYNCRLVPETISHKAYGRDTISERHRHRYELNNEYREILKKNGLVMAGLNPEKDLVEIVEVKDHPFFVATQFHPEFKSRPLRPHPLFKQFVKQAVNYQARVSSTLTTLTLR